MPIFLAIRARFVHDPYMFFWLSARRPFASFAQCMAGVVARGIFALRAAAFF